MTTSTVTVEQFSALRGFKHFDVVALSASTVQFDWRTHIHVRAFIDILSAQHVRVRFFDASIAQFEVRRATAQRVVRELLGAIRRQVTEFPRVENCFQIDFDLLERQITPTSSPLMRSMLCGALVNFLQPLIAGNEAVRADVERLIELHFVELQDAVVGKRVELDSLATRDDADSSN